MTMLQSILQWEMKQSLFAIEKLFHILIKRQFKVSLVKIRLCSEMSKCLLQLIFDWLSQNKWFLTLTQLWHLHVWLKHYFRNRIVLPLVCRNFWQFLPTHKLFHKHCVTAHATNCHLSLCYLKKINWKGKDVTTPST